MTNATYKGCPTAFAHADGATKVWKKGAVNANAGDYTDRLKAVDLLDDNCVPTSLSFTPAVSLDPSKTKVAFWVKLTTATNGTARERIIKLVADTTTAVANTAHEIAQYLFLYSGIDLMRQQNVDHYFNYTPLPDTLNFQLQANQEITITGRSAGVVEPDGSTFEIRDVATDMRFLLIPPNDLPPDTIDFTAAQWGEEKLIHSCSSRVNTAT